MAVDDETYWKIYNQLVKDIKRCENAIDWYDEQIDYLGGELYDAKEGRKASYEEYMEYKKQLKEWEQQDDGKPNTEKRIDYKKYKDITELIPKNEN